MDFEELEAAVIEEVKFSDYVLEECRRRNKILQVELGMSYGKYVGVGTVYEEAVHAFRKVKGELDVYLRSVRAEQKLKNYPKKQE